MNEILGSILNSITPEQGVKMAKRYGVDFSIDEAKVILPFLKEHKNELKIENKNRLLQLARNKVSSTTYKKIETLVNKLS